MRANPKTKLVRLLSSLGAIWLVLSVSDAAEWVSTESQPGDFVLMQMGRCAEIVIAPEDFAVVTLAARNLAEDVERVTGCKPALRTNISPTTTAVFIGTLGRSALIDGLVKEGKINVAALKNQWESFLIVTVTNPVPGVKQALVIVGSDRRGTAFGVYELSQEMGVSPWHWWADVIPERKSALFVKAGARKFGPPSVKYRGIFLNDEDWGLQPWAAKTFEPEVGDIGPKTYGKLFELLLRLKANTLWPAMHKCTKPFNHYPGNARLANDYAIIMGSSHAEPMLRNNVGEWTAPPEQFNYASNRSGVLRYWEERVATNGSFENIYTLGMRGIHDSAMQGPRSNDERIKLLEQIFADQRALLTRYVQPEVERVPQIFCAYKEVLDLYRGGLKVPDDVTVVWPDDNFGYVRNFATAAERGRKGGFGVYYHGSYLGRPLSYLWLSTIPPALIWEEMHKAYEHGADQLWILNVGDLKPAELTTEFFLQMAWDIKRWQPDNLPEFFRAWAEREFGAKPAAEIAAVMQDYFRLNFQRKPEHLQWWFLNQSPQPSPFTPTEREERLTAFADLQARTDKIQSTLAKEKLDAFFELVAYPVGGAAAANERYFCGEMAALTTDETAARSWAARARDADARLKSLTQQFNEVIAAGKWRGFMRLEPADNEWRSMRIASWKIPQFTNASITAQLLAQKPAVPLRLGKANGFAEQNGVVSIRAEHFNAQASQNAAAWKIIPGLGREGSAVTILPSTMPGITTAQITNHAPRLDYAVDFASTGDFAVQFYFLPTHPLPGGRLRIAFGLDDEAPQIAAPEYKDGSSSWAQGVLDNVRIAAARLKVSAPGKHTLCIYGVEAGVVLEKIVIDCGGLRPSYLGPKETRAAAE